MFVLIVLGAATDDAAAAKKVALIVGNSAYKHAGELINPKHDAADMSAALRKLGFQVVDGIDLDKTSFDRKIREFAVALGGAEVGLFFYAGHGLQVGGQNYLVPVDAELTTAAALDFEMVRLDLVHRTMEREANTNILFLDACRNNPLERNLRRAMGTRSTEIGRGLAAVESGVGTLISFSTQPGNVAADGVGRNSPFAGALVKQLATSTEDLSSMLIAVRNDVMKETQRQQVPWEHSALTGRVYLGAAPTSTPSLQPSTSEVERMWAWVKDSTDIRDLEAFRQQYGKAYPLYDRMAEKRIDELRKQPAPKPPEAGPAVAGGYAVEKVSSITGRIVGTRQLSIDASKPDSAVGACAKACDTVPGCLAFDISVVYGKCTLYDSVEKKADLGGYISGMRKKPQ